MQQVSMRGVYLTIVLRTLRTFWATSSHLARHTGKQCMHVAIRMGWEEDMQPCMQGVMGIRHMDQQTGQTRVGACVDG